MTMASVRRAAICLVALTAAYVAPALADPRKYPQFAQHDVDASIRIDFTHVEILKEKLDAGARLVVVDVRSTEEYDDAHIPGARSIPLDTLPKRLAEIPRDVPVVLY